VNRIDRDSYESTGTRIWKLVASAVSVGLACALAAALLAYATSSQPIPVSTPPATGRAVPPGAHAVLVYDTKSEPKGAAIGDLWLDRSYGGALRVYAEDGEWAYASYGAVLGTLARRAQAEKP
jgi:hypothetical protein